MLPVEILPWLHIEPWPFLHLLKACRLHSSARHKHLGSWKEQRVILLYEMIKQKVTDFILAFCSVWLTLTSFLWKLN